MLDLFAFSISEEPMEMLLTIPYFLYCIYSEFNKSSNYNFTNRAVPRSVSKKYIPESKARRSR